MDFLKAGIKSVVGGQEATDTHAQGIETVRHFWQIKEHCMYAICQFVDQIRGLCSPTFYSRKICSRLYRDEVM